MSNFILCEPLGYAPFIAVMKRAHIILTDSGGVQEEAPAIGSLFLPCAIKQSDRRPLNKVSSSWLGLTTIE